MGRAHAIARCRKDRDPAQLRRGACHTGFKALPAEAVYAQLHVLAKAQRECVSGTELRLGYDDVPVLGGADAIDAKLQAIHGN